MIPNVSTSFVATTDAAAAEKAIVTTPLDKNHGTATGFVLITGHINVTPGTTTSAVVLKLYQGSGLTGTLVKTLTRTLAAAVVGQLAFTIQDTAPIAGLQYTMSITQTAGAAAGTVNDAILVATPYPQG